LVVTYHFNKWNFTIFLLTLLLEAIGKPEIKSSIGNKQVVTIYYKGDKTINAGYRDIEVYALGISKAGNPVIRAWQRRGVTDTEMPGWKIV